jgi:lipopolysaccharide export system permease protein
MTILDRYVAREFLKLFGLIVVSFIFLYLVFDFFEKINMFMSNRASLTQMASFFLFNIPMIVSLTLPAAVLLAALITFGVMAKNSEIVAMKANGISLHRTSLPLIILAAAICVAAFLFSEFVTPQTNQMAFQILKVEVQKRTELGTFKQNQIWYRSRQAVYNFRIFHPDRNLLQGITINYLDPQFQLTMRVDAERAEWKDGHWLFQNVLIARFNAGDFPVLERHAAAVIDLPEKPADFMIAQKDADKMGYLELRQYIEKLRSDGYDTTRYRADLHGKIAFPLVSIILAIIGISFSLRSERSGGVTQSIGAGIVIGFSYWLVFAFAMSLGRAGTLPPLLAAWTANIVFGVASFLMYRRVKT